MGLQVQPQESGVRAKAATSIAASLCLEPLCALCCTLEPELELPHGVGSGGWVQMARGQAPGEQVAMGACTGK